MKVLITGASGFVGSALCARLSREGVDFIATARTPGPVGSPAARIEPRDLEPDTDWSDLLGSVDVVVHAAARVHVTSGPDSLSEYRRVNVDGTVNLARQAAGRGIKRFVFLSSVKVNGESTLPGHAFSAQDPAAPGDAYAISKYEAEKELLRLAGNGDMQVVSIRPPLVYGPGVKANFATLMRLVHKGYPMPFARVRNMRSFIAMDNLVDLVKTCCTHPLAANETFMAADGEDVSTGELVRRLGIALNRPARLLPVPPKLLLALAAAAGRRKQAEKALASLQVDVRRTRERLGWQPVVGMEEALTATASHFLEGLR